MIDTTHGLVARGSRARSSLAWPADWRGRRASVRRGGPRRCGGAGGGQREHRLRQVNTFRPRSRTLGQWCQGWGGALPPHCDREDDAVPCATPPSGPGVRPGRRRARRPGRRRASQLGLRRPSWRGGRRHGWRESRLGAAAVLPWRAGVAVTGLAMLAAACSAHGPGQAGPAGASRAAGSQAAHPATAAGSPAGPARARSAGPLSLQVSPAPYQLPSGLAREIVLPAGPDLLLAGGLTTRSTSTAAVRRLNPSTGSTVRVGRLTVPTHDAAGATLGGRTYVFGGGEQSSTATVQEITARKPTAAHGTATVAGRLPRPRSDLVAVTQGGTAYLLGGYDGAGTTRRSWRPGTGAGSVSRPGCRSRSGTRRSPRRVARSGSSAGRPATESRTTSSGSPCPVPAGPEPVRPLGGGRSRRAR